MFPLKKEKRCLVKKKNLTSTEDTKRKPPQGSTSTTCAKAPEHCHMLCLVMSYDGCSGNFLRGLAFLLINKATYHPRSCWIPGMQAIAMTLSSQRRMPDGSIG